MFSAYRTNGFPTAHNDLKTAVTEDILEVGILFATLIVVVSLILSLPGFRGKAVSVRQLIIPMFQISVMVVDQIFNIR